MLDENDPTHSEVLIMIKMKFREETFTRESIEGAIHAHGDLVGQNCSMVVDPPANTVILLLGCRLGSFMSISR